MYIYPNHTFNIGVASAFQTCIFLSFKEWIKCFHTHQFSSGSLSSLLSPRCLVWSLDTPRRSPLLKDMISDYLVISGNHWPLEFLDPTSWRKPESCTVWVFQKFPHTSEVNTKFSFRSVVSTFNGLTISPPPPVRPACPIFFQVDTLFFALHNLRHFLDDLHLTYFLHWIAAAWKRTQLSRTFGGSWKKGYLEI